MACAHKEAVHAVLVEQLYVGSLVYEILIRDCKQKTVSLELQQMLHERGELHIEGSLGFRKHDTDGLRAAVAQVHGHLVFPVSHSLCSVQNKTYGFLAHVL